MLRALDLFCGQGGVTRGLQYAGFHVTGVDIKQSTRYVGDDFILADALTVSLDGYDLIWASPPCQHYSQVTPKRHKHLHADLIVQVRERIADTGIPYVIENVSGARHLLRSPVMLCGSMFGLRTRRHRWFETSFKCVAPKKCDHTVPPLLVTTAGANSRAIRQVGSYKSVKNAPLAYGIDWMDFTGLKEAIPPAYAYYIAEQVAC